jgi:unsaturated rhamnogalacturonyl hydrolase
MANTSVLIDRLIDRLLHNEDESNEKFLLRLDDGRIIDTKGWNGWEWTHGVALFGLWEHYRLTGATKSLDIIEKWFKDRMAEGGTTKNINTMAPFLALACVYEHQSTKNPQYRAWLEEWAEWCMNELPRTKEGGFQHITYLEENRQQLWDDTLVMTCLPLAKIGKVLGRIDYVEEAKYQFLVHTKYLSDRKTGLWFHGWTFEGNHNFAEARWARGNCWITLAIPMLLSILDEKESFFSRALLETLRTQLDALCPLQDSETGLFHTLLDDPTSYVESSATAGFAAGTLYAIRTGLIDDKQYKHMANNALQGVVNMIAEDGELKQTSFGTGMGSDLDFYRKIPITPMPYGQALALFALTQSLTPSS